MKEKLKMKKMLMTTVLITAGIVMIGGNASRAALQSNATTHAKPANKTGSYFMEEIRKMETSGQTMGLSETLNNDLSPKTSNNIDVHMMKSTEYGAMAILSASGFGNPKKLSEVSIKTTTGNVTGVYLTGDRWEWSVGTVNGNIVGKNARYYELYGTVKPGDALGKPTDSNPGCTMIDGDGDYAGAWHEGRIFDMWFTSCLTRGGAGIFSANAYTYEYTDSELPARGVASVGSGI